MSETTEFGRGRRTSYLDRTWLNHWTVLMLAPIKAPDLAGLRSKMVGFIAENPRHPLACTLEEDGRRWRAVARHDRERHVNEVIVPGGEFDIEDPFDHLDRNRPVEGSTAPFKLVIGQDSILFYLAHAVGDMVVFAPLSVLMSLGDVDGLKTFVADAGLPVATKLLAREIRPHWRGWWQHTRKSDGAAPPADEGDGGAGTALMDHAPTTTARGVLVSPAEFSAFKDWRKKTCPGLATTALMASATFVAMEHEGIPLNDKGFYTLVDVRRYLPKKQALRPANLAKSTYISADMHDAAAIGDGVKGLVESARAVPALLAGAVSVALGGSSRSSSATRLEPLTMTFNSMMRIPGIEHYPWIDPHDAHFITMSYHVGVNRISVSVCAVEDGLSISACFDPTRIRPAVVSRALGHLRDMPELLTSRSAAAGLKLVDQC